MISIAETPLILRVPRWSGPQASAALSATTGCINPRLQATSCLDKKTRRNRFRSSALQNPWVLLSASTMANQSQLSINFARKASDERTASLPRSSFDVSFILDLSAAKSSTARYLPDPSGTTMLEA